MERQRNRVESTRCMQNPMAKMLVMLRRGMRAAVVSGAGTGTAATVSCAAGRMVSPAHRW